MTGPASSSGTIPARRKLPLASVCETKPISRGRAGMGEGRQGRQCRYHWAKACETKPIPPGRRDGQVLCGKRVMTSLTRKRRRQNKANSRTDRNGQGPARLPSAAGGTNRVKQSQFALVPAKIKVLATRRRKKSGEDAQPTKKHLAASVRMCRRPRSKRAKQSQFPQSDVKGKYLVEKEL